jgi:diguanylate cyclase (GGDEF)-like protein
LASTVRDYETAARLGGDEFVVVLEDIPDENEAQKVMQRLTSELRKPIWLSQETFEPSVSIGMAIFPRDGESPKELLRAADMSMYLVKHLSKDGVEPQPIGSLLRLAERSTSPCV